jgi:hypothetical protein
MSDFVTAVANLVDVADNGGKPDWALRQAVHAALKALSPRDTKGTATGIKALVDAEKRLIHHPQQVLLLALGALVEAGAPPELVWPAAVRRLPETLEGAIRFAEACVDQADDPSFESVKMVGHVVEKRMPAEAEAWALMGPKCLAGVACLTRSSALRQEARKNRKLLAALEPLHELTEPPTFLVQAILVLDDEPLLVIHPESRRGFRLVMNDISTNLELYLLTLDRIVGDPKKGFLKAARPNPRAVAVLKDPDAVVRKTPEIDIPFHTYAWTALLPDGTLPDSTVDREVQHWVWTEGVPIEIPKFEGDRVILLTKPVMKRTEPIEPVFAALSPRVKLVSKVPAAEVDRLLAKMASAAAKLPKIPRPGIPFPTKPPAKKTAKNTAKKTAGSDKPAKKKAAKKR